ncbi:MAG: ATP-dependent RecD-like DNA helicase [Planctomycetes bacterium]|nr:ATP-dependent RecD-like DNA helicase [Planctomycetota bacterium]
MNRDETPAREGDPSPGREVVQGTVERVTYADATSLYTVLKIDPEKGYDIPAGRGPFRPTRVTAVGRVDAPTEGVRVRLEGRWTEHKNHGLQFEFELLEVLQPRDRYGLVRYLSSSRFPGIGEKTAERIVEKLGDKALEVILADPKSLIGVRGLKLETREALVGALFAEAGTHRANVFLRELGLGPQQSAAVIRKLGLECEALIRNDPYVLASGIPGIGFALADRARAALEIAVDDPRRARAGVLHALRLASEEGHTLLARERLLQNAQALFGDAIPLEALESALGVLVEQRNLVEEEGKLWLPHLYHCESELAKNLARLLALAPVRPLADARALAAAEQRSGIELHPLQREAVLGLLAAPVALLTGGPGVGKTTIVRFVVSLAESVGTRVLLASPTGRAAKRLSEATGGDAQTIHRMLGYDPVGQGFLHDAQNPLEADLVIVDEISMLDVVLGHHLLKAVAAPTRILFVGDPNQLPSVGPGNVLHDMLGSQVVPTYRLTHIYRQSQGSLIVTNAHRILDGEEPELPEPGDRKSDFYFFPADDALKCAERVVEVVTQRIPQTFGLDWTKDVQVLAPMYKGECGVDALNERLREERAKSFKTVRELRQGARVWRVGDRVIHTRNDYEKEVFNGDMGEIVRVGDDNSLVVRFPEREVPYTGAEVGDLQPAFAITVHRSQGGEFPAVVFPLVTQHYVMLQRHLLYTAVTRAKRLVVLVGSKRALRMAIDNAEQGSRESALAKKLADLRS